MALNASFAIRVSFQSLIKSHIPLEICTDRRSLYECLLLIQTTTEKRLFCYNRVLCQRYERHRISLDNYQFIKISFTSSRLGRDYQKFHGHHLWSNSFVLDLNAKILSTSKWMWPTSGSKSWEMLRFVAAGYLFFLFSVFIHYQLPLHINIYLQTLFSMKERMRK